MIFQNHEDYGHKKQTPMGKVFIISINEDGHCLSTEKNNYVSSADEDPRPSLNEKKKIHVIFILYFLAIKLVFPSPGCRQVPALRLGFPCQTSPKSLDP